jgi:hypothetical protein
MANCKTTVKYPIIIDCTGEVLEIEDLDFVPYTGANKDVNLGEFGLKTGNLEFDTSPTDKPITEGSVSWNSTDGTIDVTLKGAKTTLQVGQEQVIRVVNGTGANLTEAGYKCVRINDAQGQRPKVVLAEADTNENTLNTIGLVTEDISNNQEGYVTTFGLVRDINTTGSIQGESWADGDVLYLSAATAGALTKTPPSKQVIVGFVVHAHNTQGSIFVRIHDILASTGAVPLYSTRTFSSTGLLTSFSFNHSLGTTPTTVLIEALTQDARDYSHITYNSTSVTINYLVAPPVGINNLIFNASVI